MEVTIKRIVKDMLERIRDEISKQCTASYHTEWRSADCCNYYGCLVRIGFSCEDEKPYDVLIINPPANGEEIVGRCLEWELRDARFHEVVTQCLGTHGKDVWWIPPLV